MNNYQLFEVGDVIRLRDDLIVQDFLHIEDKYIVREMLFILVNFTRLMQGRSFSNTYVRVERIINEKILLVEFVESDIDKFFLIGKSLYICTNFIDKDVQRVIFLERNSKKRVRRYDNKLKNNNYGKSKFFHKDKFERK